MRRCARAGYPVRAVILPIIPLDSWQELYSGFLIKVLKPVRLERITPTQFAHASHIIVPPGGLHAIGNDERLPVSPANRMTSICKATCQIATETIPDARQRYVAA